MIRKNGNSELVINQWVAGLLVTLFLTITGWAVSWGATRESVNSIKKEIVVVVNKINDLDKCSGEVNVQLIDHEKRLDKLEIKR